MPVNIEDIPFVRRRKRMQFGPPPPTPVALTLVAASYDADVGPTLRLTFDKPIDVDALVGSAITVDDGSNLGLKFAATGGATLETPTRLALVLVEIDNATGTDLRLDATNATCIVAVDDGGAWAGATELLLPFP